jgi:hypothetical protein
MYKKFVLVHWTLSLSKRLAPFDWLRERLYLSLFISFVVKILPIYL